MRQSADQGRDNPLAKPPEIIRIMLDSGYTNSNFVRCIVYTAFKKSKNAPIQVKEGPERLGISGNAMNSEGG